MDAEVDDQGGVEVEEQLQRFSATLSELRRALTQLKSSPPNSSYSRQSEVLRIHRLKQELRPEAISRLVKQQQALQEQYTALTEECEAQLLAVSKEQLLERYERTHAGAQDDAKNEGTQQMQRQQLVTLGDDVQDQTQGSLTRTQHMVAETEDMGGQILERMQQQNEQLEGVRGNLDDVQYNLARAKKTAQAIAKNAASDKCMQCLCICVTLFGIASIVLIALPGR